MADDPKPKCFVVMPITVPPDRIETYAGGKDHFRHVLRYLFRPALESAEFEVVEPISRGSSVIMGDIIRNLEQSELVLCDMSILNANVFFELGIRTALDRPVAVVRDETIVDLPFDMGQVNAHRYDSNLHGWDLDDQREALAAHVRDTWQQRDPEEPRNPLWHHFGLTKRNAGKDSPVPSDSEAISTLVGEVGQLRNALTILFRSDAHLPRGPRNIDVRHLQQVRRELWLAVSRVPGVTVSPKDVRVSLEGDTVVCSISPDDFSDMDLIEQNEQFNNDVDMIREILQAKVKIDLIPF